MYELVQVSEKCYCINSPAKIGVYVEDGENVYLVDSGNDKDAGRKVRQILDFRTLCCSGIKHNFMTRKQSGRHTGKARKI